MGPWIGVPGQEKDGSGICLKRVTHGIWHRDGHAAALVLWNEGGHAGRFLPLDPDPCVWIIGDPGDHEEPGDARAAEIAGNLEASEKNALELLRRLRRRRPTRGEQARAEPGDTT